MPAGCQDGTVRVYDADTGAMKYILRGHMAEVLALCTVHDAGMSVGAPPVLTPTPSHPTRHTNLLLCSGSADATIRVWSTRSYTCLHVLREHADRVVALTARGRLCIATSTDATARVFDTSHLPPTRAGDAHHAMGSVWPPAASHATASPRGSAKALHTPVPPGDAVAHGSSLHSAMAAPHTLQDAELLDGGSMGAPVAGGVVTPASAATAASALASAYEHSVEVSALLHSARVNDTDGSSSNGSSSLLASHVPVLAHMPGSPVPSALMSPHPSSTATATVDLSQHGLLTALRELVAIPSVSVQEHGKTRDVNACWRAARYIHSLATAIGGECKLVQGVPGANPLILVRMGGWDVPTLCCHAHYDLQPAGDARAWESPPFVLTGRDGYVYARGASDNKGPLLAMLFAAARCLRALSSRSVSGKAPLAFAFVLEGEGENGSLGFREAVTQNLEWLRGTCLILNCNNTWIGEDVPCITYGMRGMVKVRVEVEGATSDLHSGLDGGVTHEPLADLCALLGALCEPDTGALAVPGIYDEVAPLTAAEVQMYRDVAFDVDEYMQSRGLRGVFSSCTLPLHANAQDDASQHASAQRLAADALVGDAHADDAAYDGDERGEARAAKRRRVHDADFHSVHESSIPVAESGAGANASASLRRVSSRKAIAARGSADVEAGMANTTYLVTTTEGAQAHGAAAMSEELASIACYAPHVATDVPSSVRGRASVPSLPPATWHENDPVDAFVAQPRTSNIADTVLGGVTTLASSTSLMAAGAAARSVSATALFASPVACEGDTTPDAAPREHSAPTDADNCAPEQSLDVAATVLLRRWREPSVSIHGVTSSSANDSLIPHKASGFLSVRTVPHMTSHATFRTLAAYLTTQFARRRSVNKLTVTMTSHAAWWLQSPTAPFYRVSLHAVPASRHSRLHIHMNKHIHLSMHVCVCV